MVDGVQKPQRDISFKAVYSGPLQELMHKNTSSTFATRARVLPPQKHSADVEQY